MNVQFGSAATPSHFAPSQGSEARPNVAVPSEAENQSTTSFTPVDEPPANRRSQQDDARQGVESRQAREESRAERRRDENRSERVSANSSEQEQVIEDNIEQRRAERQAQDQAQADRLADERRQQEAAEQRQLEAELQQIQKLAERDREVRAHEQAHQAVGGQFAGAASYSYERGPDGKNYAVGGEVPIDASAIANDPQATLDKAETIRRAALAPAEPSSQDRRVAAQAVQMAVEARADIQQMKREEAIEEAQQGEDREVQEESEQERLEAEQKAQQEEQQDEIVSESNAADLQELNERLSRIQAQLVEASQIDDRVNSQVNLLDVST